MLSHQERGEVLAAVAIAARIAHLLKGGQNQLAQREFLESIHGGRHDGGPIAAAYNRLRTDKGQQRLSRCLRSLTEMLGRMYKQPGPDQAEALVSYCAEIREHLSATPDHLPQPKLNRKGTVNGRMLEMVQRGDDCRGWKAREWAQALKCGRSTVMETPTWKSLETIRLAQKAERSRDRHRRQKRGSRRSR